MDVPHRVLIDNKASSTHTVIEVNGRDQPGLLHRLTKSLAEQNLQISSAKISTYGASIVDVFIADLNGDVHGFTAPKIDTGRAHVNAVF